MAIRLFLSLVAVAGVMWYLAWYQRATPSQRNQSLRTVLLYGVGIALLLLVITGRIPWLFAIFSAAVPWISRAMTAKSLWNRFRNPAGTARESTRQQQQQGRSIESMTKSEAFEVLGLDASATRDEIVAAHRKLISKIHPDKGGTDYLARSINKAREVLLSDET
ncbi:MAG: DnaJ domain-containing protein [Acidiferrobacterales bacterium]|nr:DnaJ domain-containing protein [Acidiferrobacterales bacterium]